jgi:subtilase family serine protease
MRFRTSSLFGLCRVLSSVAALLLFMAGSAQGQSIMTRHTRREVTSGQAKFANRLPGTQILRLDIVLPLRDQAGLEDFLQEVYDPTSPIYRHFLTVPEFTERFGPTQEDYDAVVAFAKGSGFKVVGGSRDGLELQVEGSVTVIEAAFNVAMGVYQHPTENRSFYAPDREPSAPLGFPLWHISGLDNFSVPHPAGLHRNPNGKPNATTGSGPSASFLGSDMRAAYYGGTALTGAGQSVGLVEFYGTDLADVNTYFTNVGQTNNVPITLISTDGTSTSCLYSMNCDDAEPTLDITQAVSMAPGLTRLYVYVGGSDTAILSAMTTTKYAPLSAQLSCSWSWTPADPTTADPYFMKMSAQGQNFFAAAGDSGAWGLTSHPYPAEDAYVVSVGGTDLSTASAGGAWASETAWTDSGGGISPHHFAIPSWQKLSGVVNASNRGSTSYRNGPDVSANANFSYYVCADQNGCTANLYGGTSFAAPLWAGYMALVNQQAVANIGRTLGFICPTIYSLVAGQGNKTGFHDITSGANGYPAVKGYDLVTGWGSPNGASLINALTGAPDTGFTVSASPTTVSVSQGSSGTSTVTTAVSGGFNSSIALSASGEPNGVTVSFGPPSITGAGTSTMTMSVSATTPAGTYPITVTGTSGNATQSTTVSLKVASVGGGGDFTVRASPASRALAWGSSGTSTITTTVSGGFSSAIALSASGVASGVTVSFSPSTIAAPGSGTSTMTITVRAGAKTGNSTITITATGGGVTHTTPVALNVAI